jgi:hypothetical protein
MNKMYNTKEALEMLVDTGFLEDCPVVGSSLAFGAISKGLEGVRKAIISDFENWKNNGGKKTVKAMSKECSFDTFCFDVEVIIDDIMYKGMFTKDKFSENAVKNAYEWIYSFALETPRMRKFMDFRDYDVNPLWVLFLELAR